MATNISCRADSPPCGLIRLDSLPDDHAPLPRVQLMNILLLWLAPGIFDINSGVVYGDRTHTYNAFSQDLHVTLIWEAYGFINGKSRSTIGDGEFIFPHTREENLIQQFATNVTSGWRTGYFNLCLKKCPLASSGLFPGRRLFPKRTLEDALSIGDPSSSAPQARKS
ncbi:hypothetical protein Dsin_013828 [Dipteronia sinensis]|uniref:Uncharacterized protein n=1 Tax=Dipteronia sinensis TaxID=43782 RepID=A0AAE0AL63_9ROSI|nr:hypothetical protein Dsin_013828 [Dipteronia sinensis]